MRAAFADSLRLVWRVLLAFAGAGLLSVLLQRDVALHGKMDRRWGMKEGKGGKGGKGGKESKEGAAEEGKGEGALDAPAREKSVDVAKAQLGGEVQVIPRDALQPDTDHQD